MMFLILIIVKAQMKNSSKENGVLLICRKKKETKCQHTFYCNVSLFLLQPIKKKCNFSDINTVNYAKLISLYDVKILLPEKIKTLNGLKKI